MLTSKFLRVAPILLRGRSARQNNVPVRPRPGKQLKSRWNFRTLKPAAGRRWKFQPTLQRGGTHERHRIDPGTRSRSPADGGDHWQEGSGGGLADGEVT